MQQEPGGGGRAPQGSDFPDQSSHKSFEYASPSGNAFYYLNTLPSTLSDRSGSGSFVGNTYASLFGDNSYNGAKSEAHKEMYNLGHLGAETMQQYISKEALKMAMGPNSVTSGMRPIDFPGLSNSMYSNNWTHEHHLDVAHEQVFWTGPMNSKGSFILHNSGSDMFHPKVVVDSKFPGNIETYRFSRTIYHDVPQTNNSAEMEQILNSARGSYWLFTNNCQHLKQNGYLGMGLAPQ